MRLVRLAAWLLPRARACMAGRRADLRIGPPERPYLLRWVWLPRNPLGNVYLHQFLDSDDDRALHDHPWPSVSLLLAGGYIEHRIAAGGVHRRRHYRPGALIVRSPWYAHRIELLGGRPAVSLFLIGPRVRHWGFHCPNGWRHWRAFTSEGGRRIGQGCD